MKRFDRLETQAGCLFGLFFVILPLINVTIGAMCFDYCLWNLFQKNIHWFGDCLCALFVAELAMPVALVIFILKIFGVDFPL